VVIDPRTQRLVTTACQCHLIPDCFKVSNKTVALDGPFDHKIGEQCDSQLKAVFDLLVGGTLNGAFAFEGGSKNMAGSLQPVTGQFSIKQRIRNKKPGRKAVKTDVALRRSLGLRNGRLVKLEGFVTPSVDLAKARLSMVNSAFLVLYYLNRTEIYDPEFDQARELLNKVCEGKLENSDMPLIESMTPSFGSVYISTEKTKGLKALNPADIRHYYDPTLALADGVLDDFPKQCVAQEGESLIVRLPYGKCLRGIVRFPLAS
jgi:hypothetical protein